MPGRRLQDIFIIEMFLYIICGWLIIGLWQRFIENFFYNGLGLDRELPYHNFIVMFIITTTFLFIVSFLMEISYESENYGIDSPYSPNELKYKTSSNTNGMSTNGQNYRRNIDGNQEEPVRKFQTIIAANPSNTNGHRGLSTIIKSGDNGHNRIRKRQKDLVEDRLHRVDKVLSNWSSRDW